MRFISNFFKFIAVIDFFKITQYQRNLFCCWLLCKRVPHLPKQWKAKVVTQLKVAPETRPGALAQDRHIMQFEDKTVGTCRVSFKIDILLSEEWRGTMCKRTGKEDFHTTWIKVVLNCRRIFVLRYPTPNY